MSTEPRAVVRLLLSFLATAGLALASVVWSESWFYGSWRHQDSVPGFLQTVAGYGLVVQVARFVAFRWRVAASGRGAWRRVFLIGALFGWLVEGVLVSTVITVLPLSLSYTGLAWHALFTVLLGWWLIPRLLAGGLLRSIAPLVGVGVGLGAWDSFWKLGHGLDVSLLDYSLFVAATTAAYAAGLAIWWASRSRANPGWRGSLVAIAALLVVAVVHAISNPLTLLGPVLVGIALFAIARTAPVLSPPSDVALLPVALLPVAGPTPWRGLWRLVLIPAAAIAVFTVIRSASLAVGFGWTFVAATAVAGAVLFVVAWARSGRRASRASG